MNYFVYHLILNIFIIKFKLALKLIELNILEISTDF